MKKFDIIIALLLVITVMFSVLLWLSPIAGEHEDICKYKPGDATGNGTVGIIDYSMVKLHIYKVIILTPAQRIRADIDHDGDVDRVDFACIREIIWGGE